VRREVYALLWRQYLGVVRIQAVLLDNFGARQLRELGFGELEERQWIRAHDIRDPQAVSKLVAASFADLTPIDDNAMARWTNELTDILSKVDNGPTLDAFAERLGVEKSEWASRAGAPGCHRFLAHQLLGNHTAENISVAIKAVKHELLSERTVELARRATPALVDVAAASSLLKSPRPVFVINAEYWTTAQLYVRRAGCCSYGFRQVYVSVMESGEDLEDDFTIQCDIALAELLSIPDTDPHNVRTRKEVADFTPTKNGDVEAGFLVVQAKFHQLARLAKELGKLRERVRWLALVVLDGEDTVAWAEVEKKGTLPKGFELVKPLLNDGQERNINRVLRRLAEDINGGTLFDATNGR
jgi:hypothetical protein